MSDHSHTEAEVNMKEEWGMPPSQAFEQMSTLYTADCSGHVKFLRTFQQVNMDNCPIKFSSKLVEWAEFYVKSEFENSDIQKARSFL